MDDASAFVMNINRQPPPPRPDIYHVLYNHLEATVKLPHIFSNQFLHTVPTQVVMTDPVGNELNLTIKKTHQDVSFTHGWNYIGEFYGLQEGGWVTMFYTSHGNFKIHVTNLKGDTINYPPMPAPILTNGYHNPILVEDDDDEMEDDEPPRHMVDRSNMITAVKKWLSYEEVTGRQLGFSQSWCQYALPKEDGHLSLVDEYGRVWPCYYKAKFRDANNGGIHRGWKAFCRRKKLYQGRGAKFGVMTPNANVLYYSPSS